MRSAALSNTLSTFFMSDVNSPSNNDSYTPSGSSFSRKRVRRFLRRSPYIPFGIVGLIVLLVLIFAIKNISEKNSVSPLSTTNSPSDKRVDIEKPLAVENINKEFQFSLKDQTGKEISKLKYQVQSAELRNQIVIKGEKATAVKGRTFLIVNLKITNTFNKSIQINVKDYIRLIANGSEEKLAPDIHNDPVDVQAISTKYTRVGFPINDSDKNLTLQIGEIDGKKEFIKLNLR